MKVCSKCKVEKDLSAYHKRNNRKCGVRSICKDCYKCYPKKRSEGYSRKYDLKRSYSITVEEYNEKLIKQGCKCAICDRLESSLSGRKKHLCIDHNHDTNNIRGLLCDKCNRAIGLFNDDIVLLNKAIEYLKTYSS